jgi:hypothetical protein
MMLNDLSILFYSASHHLENTNVFRSAFGNREIYRDFPHTKCDVGFKILVTQDNLVVLSIIDNPISNIVITEPKIEI